MKIFWPSWDAFLEGGHDWIEAWRRFGRALQAFCAAELEALALIIARLSSNGRLRLY